MFAFHLKTNQSFEGVFGFFGKMSDKLWKIKVMSEFPTLTKLGWQKLRESAIKNSIVPIGTCFE